MISDSDLRRLAEMQASERAFLSVYLSDSRSVKGLDKKLQKLRRTLSAQGPERSERDHFDENVKQLQLYLEKHPLKSGGLCLFICWALDFLEAIELTAQVGDYVGIDSSPYVRPLAELKDEYENVAVIVADNKRARIFLLTAAVPGPEETVEGNIKNHVRKGGWSQQRYERRRDKELLLYAREIADVLKRLDRAEHFRRIVLVGGKEILRIILSDLPPPLAKKVAGSKAIDLGKGEETLYRELWDLYFKEERRSETSLWETIRAETLRGGLGRVGLGEVLNAATTGRIEKLVVDRTFHPRGVRCRKCNQLHTATVSACSSCGSDSLYPVDVVNEICELLAQTGAEADFVDADATLAEAGRIGALLRY